MSQEEIKSEKKAELKKKMRELKIFEKDIKETFVRSSGPGGQNVNKVSTCVHLHHLPSGTQIKCQEGRTQGINRHQARLLLVRKIEQDVYEEKLKAIQRKEKARRRNRKRSKRLKEEMLERKRQQSEKKQSRSKIKTNKLDDYL